MATELDPPPTAEKPAILNYTVPTRSRLWPPIWCGLFLFFSFVAQTVFLPCLCGHAINLAKSEFALALDLLFVGRVLLARRLRQTNYDWLIYGVLLLSSAFWIEEALTNSAIRALYAHIGIVPYP